MKAALTRSLSTEALRSGAPLETNVQHLHPMPEFYGEDLAFIHHVGFGNFSRTVGVEVRAILEKAELSRGLIIELACGSGLLAQILLDAGYSVLGIDASRAMVDLARINAPGARFVAARLWDVELPRSSAILCVGEGLSYFAPDDPRPLLPSFFRRAYASLIPGGYLIFDLIVTAAAEPMNYRSGREGTNWRLQVDVQENPDQNLLTRAIAITRTVDGVERHSRELHRVRIFSSSEIEHLLVLAGFSVQAARAYGATTLPARRTAFIARKEIGAQLA